MLFRRMPIKARKMSVSEWLKKLQNQKLYSLTKYCSFNIIYKQKSVRKMLR